MTAALLFLLVATDPPVKSPKSDANIFRIEREGKWGYVDRTGRVLIEPRFEGARDFFAGLAAIKSGGKWGYIRTSGEFAIEPRFSDAGDFQDGRAVVANATTVIRADGSVVASFEEVRPFSEGLAAFRKEGKWGFIDPEGKVVIRPRFDGVGTFSSGMAPVWSNARQRYGVVGRFGHLTSDYMFETLGPFDKGLAAARLPRGVCGFTAGEAKFAIAAVDWCFEKEVPEGYGVFRNGFAAVFQDQNLAVFIDKTGRKQIPWLFHWTSGFSEGLAAVQLDDGYWTYIDTSGKHAMDLRFYEAYPFVDGLALVKAHDGWHYIRKDGSYAIKNVCRER